MLGTSAPDAMDAWTIQLRKGLTELWVLAVLARGEAYGYDIIQRLGQIDGLAVGESSVYPLLARLTQEGFMKVRAAPSPTGPPRRYYQLTAAGRTRLSQMLAHWRLVGAG